MSGPEPKRPRRSAESVPEPAMPSGWRTSRRGSRAGKKARKDLKRHFRMERVSKVTRTARRTVRDVVYLATVTAGLLLAGALVVYLVVLGVNGLARWNAQRSATLADSPEARAEKARDNLLLIAVDGRRATGFLAVRYDEEQKQIYGIAIPDGAFIEVPGQGFERVGESFEAGPEVSLAAVSNFFTVPFTSYAIVDTEIYQVALTNQSLSGVTDRFDETGMDEDAVARWRESFDTTPTERVALVPLPVKPINLGNETYFEPQREEVADLLETWWGVSLGDVEDVVRLIVYNGSGVPGIAGTAAQDLIRGGFRVVDTKNADSFDYAETKIVVQHGDASTGEKVAELLGVGSVTVQSADQQVADVIIIIGKDYEPSAGE